MTTEEKLVSMCIERGMFEDDAKLVVNSAKKVAQEVVVDYQITWDRSWLEYDEIVIGMLFLYVKQEAVKYLNEHHPKAWFKMMFE